MSLRKWYSFRKPKGSKSDDDDIEKVFELLEEGEKMIVRDENHKDPIFVLGNTGSGKSTLVRFIATDNKSLHAKEIGEDEFIIVDDNEEIGGGTTSKTMHPVLVVDETVQAAYYDCPGFNDTRSASNEIATSYFIKEIFDFAEEVKICLVVNHSSVRMGVERRDFRDLLRHTATLVKNIEKYKDSIVIFASKVENKIIKDPEQGYILQPDESIIKNIALFMESVKEEIEGKSRGKVEDEHEVKLINIFLTKDSAGNYPRIGIFRRPNEAGPICDIELLQVRKPGMKKIIYESIMLTKKDPGDFGHTISDTAKLQVNKMVDLIREKVSIEIDKVVEALQEYDQRAVGQIKKMVESFAEGSNADVDDARDLTYKLNSNFDAITKLKSNVVKAKTINEIKEAIELCSSDLSIDFEDSISKLISQDNYFEFLQNVNGGLSIGNYSKNFDGILAIIDATRKEIGKDTTSMANIVKDRIEANLNEIVKNLETCYDVKFDSLSIEDLIIEFGKQHNIVVHFVEKIKKIENAQDLSKETSNMVSKSEIESTEINAATLAVFNYGNYLTVLNIMKADISIWSSDWIKPFEDHEDYVFKAEKWYNFLERTFNKFSSYTYFGSKEKYEEIKVTKANYKSFLEDIEENDEEIKKMEVDDRKLAELNHVLDLTVKQKISTEMKSNDELQIHAVFVKFSDLVDSSGNLKSEVSQGKTVKILSVYASNTVFIDDNLNFAGVNLQVNVVAPNWEIVGTRVAILKAQPLTGASIESFGVGGKGEEGKPGSPGLPGSVGGSFVGVGYAFKSPTNLTIVSTGGTGGKGKEGGVGKTGENGSNATMVDCSGKKMISKKYYPMPTGLFIVENWNFMGFKGGAGGDGGSGGVGGLGGLPGYFKVIRTDGTSNVPAFKGVKGSTGEGATGGPAGQGGKTGNGVSIMHSYYSQPSVSRWDTDSTIVVNDRAANGSTGKPNSNVVGRKDPASADPIDIGKVLNAFEFYLREDLGDRFLKETLKQFLESLHLDEKIYTDHVYDTKSLANNLSNLEGQLYQLNNKLTNDEIIYLYQSILQRTTEYSKNPKQSEKTKDYEKALKYICTAALCQIQFRKDSLSQNLVIDVAGYLDLVLKNVNVLKDLNEKANKLKVVNEAKEDLKRNIDKKIAEAQGFIENEILPEIESVYDELAVQIDKLVDEVRELQAGAVEEKEKLEEKKRQLQNALAFNIMLGVLRAALVFAGPVGKAAGIVTQTIQKTAFSRAILKDSDVEAIKLEIKKFKEVIGKAKENKPNPQLLADIQTRYEGNAEKLSTIDDAIEHAEEKFKALQDYEKYIYDTMVPMFDDMEKMLDEVSEQLGSQSQVALDVTKWMVQSTLRDVKSQMKQMTRGFAVEDDIARCIEKLEEAMTTQINLYDSIQSFQDQKILVDYMAVVSTGIDENNPQLSQILRFMEIKIRSNLVLDQHKQAVNAVTQNVFPFAKLYLNGGFLTFTVRTEKDLDEVVAQAVKELEEMKENIERYKTSIGKQDEYITSTHFNSNHAITKPFFVWKNESNKGIISKLLAGKKVILSADVRRTNVDKFAIKFNLGEINFKAQDETIQAALNETLKHFKVSMKHMGNSYYRFNDYVYIIYSDSNTIEYSFDKLDGEPVEFNWVYGKIKDGELMLSPFAMWEIQLENAVNAGYFEVLKKFVDHVDLELVGKGNFVTEKLDVGVLNVDNYYTPEPTMLANDKW